MVISDRIVLNPEICAGKPTIKGTRLQVEFIVELLAEGWTYQDICKEYELQMEDIFAVLKYARKVLSEEEIYSFSSE